MVFIFNNSLVNAKYKLLASCTPVKECINVAHFIGTGEEVEKLPQVDVSKVIPAKGFITPLRTEGGLLGIQIICLSGTTSNKHQAGFSLGCIGDYSTTSAFRISSLSGEDVSSF